MTPLLLAIGLSAGCRVCPAAPSQPSLDPVRAAIAAAYLRASLCPPCEDPALSAAATSLAGIDGQGLPPPLAIQRAVQNAGSGDPSPRAFQVTGSALVDLSGAAQTKLPVQADDTVVGLGLNPLSTRLVVLSADRQVAVDPWPARVARGTTVTLRGTFLRALSQPSVYVEGADGKVVSVQTTFEGARFSARFQPVADGRFLVEVLGRGAGGPQVAYLRALEVGAASESPVAEEPEREGHDDSAAVLEAINRERQRYGAAALALDERLSAVATAYAAELRELNLFAHVSPRSGDLKARLARAGYRYQAAAENLAQGPSALEAQGLAAGSPAHRQAMLDPTYARCGLGLSRVLLGDGHSDVLLVELFAR